MAAQLARSARPRGPHIGAESLTCRSGGGIDAKCPALSCLRPDDGRCHRLGHLVRRTTPPRRDPPLARGRLASWLWLELSRRPDGDARSASRSSGFACLDRGLRVSSANKLICSRDRRHHESRAAARRRAEQRARTRRSILRPNDPRGGWRRLHRQRTGAQAAEPRLPGARARPALLWRGESVEHPRPDRACGCGRAGSPATCA